MLKNFLQKDRHTHRQTDGNTNRHRNRNSSLDYLVNLYIGIYQNHTHQIWFMRRKAPQFRSLLFRHYLRRWKPSSQKILINELGKGIFHLWWSVALIGIDKIDSFVLNSCGFFPGMQKAFLHSFLQLPLISIIAFFSIW